MVDASGLALVDDLVEVVVAAEMLCAGCVQTADVVVAPAGVVYLRAAVGVGAVLGVVLHLCVPAVVGAFVAAHFRLASQPSQLLVCFVPSAAVTGALAIPVFSCYFLLQASP